MPYYRIRFASENVENDLMETVTLPSTDWFLSLEKDAKRHHYQGWILLDVPYDTSGNRKAKQLIKPHLPFKPMIKFQNGTWSLTNADSEKFDDYKNYVAKEKHRWYGIYDKDEMFERHAKYWAKNKQLKGTVKKQTKEKNVLLLEKARQELYNLRCQKNEFKKLEQLELQTISSKSLPLKEGKINLRDICEVVVRCNQESVPVLDTHSLKWVLLQLFATNEDTRDEYRQTEVEMLHGMIKNRFK